MYIYMTDVKTFRVAVYGTLKKGFHNHYLLKGSKFLGNYVTGPGYTKVIKGLPYLVEDTAGVGCEVEIYEVSELTLKMLDRLEGSPDWYVRTVIKVYNPEKDLGMEVYVYLMPKERI